MLIAIGSDHAGFGLKKELVEFLKKRGVEKVRDFGPENSDSGLSCLCQEGCKMRWLRANASRAC